MWRRPGMTSMDEGIDYASSGVDIDLEGAAVSSLIGALSGSVRKPGSEGAPVDLPGGFGGLLEFGNRWLALATDGVGSKLQIANELGQLQGVGHDCVAMNVNDLLCVGAEPIAFVDYIATPKPSPDEHAALGASLAEACSLARVTLAGGETATLPGIVKELDLSGTALGWMPKDAAITGEHIGSNDVMIGIPASGIHSNGYSLVRAVLERTGADLTEPAPFDTEHSNRAIRRWMSGDVTLGEVLLNPTRIYVDPVQDLIEALDESGDGSRSDIRGIAHITGGGLSNLLRLHPSRGYHIDSPLPVLPEFHWIQEMGSVDDREMHRTFNMGTGMILIVSNESADTILHWLKERDAGVSIIGRTNDSGIVTHVNQNIRFEHY
ncbi:MAG TPA: phosphoribosylformylglycinamidine cyclo-ligase [Candidatus Poseidoniales archaeon]|nr:MAG TPA: phosphoribosylformylglycinamidine cyclo-ligase [Candidatus Poseidoniales archaeon]